MCEVGRRQPRTRVSKKKGAIDIRHKIQCKDALQPIFLFDLFSNFSFQAKVSLLLFALEKMLYDLEQRNRVRRPCNI